jgi:hypothetical protein
VGVALAEAVPVPVRPNEPPTGVTARPGEAVGAIAVAADGAVDGVTPALRPAVPPPAPAPVGNAPEALAGGDTAATSPGVPAPPGALAAPPITGPVVAATAVPPPAPAGGCTLVVVVVVTVPSSFLAQLAATRPQATTAVEAMSAARISMIGMTGP